MAVALTGIVLFLLIEGQGRASVAVVLLGLFLSIAAVDIRLAIPMVLVYLVLMGDVRKILLLYYPWSGTDPLLLVGGVFSIILTVNAFARGDISLNTKLSKYAVILMVIMIIQIFNPRQGGLMVGVAGGLFLLVPLFWFWVGRAYATPELVEAILFKIFLPICVLAGVYGTYQVFNGYLYHQRLWLEANWYAGLGDPNNPAPISFFSSGSEYNSFLAVGIVIAWAYFLRGNRTIVFIIPALFVALLLTGTRGGVLFSAVTMAVLWAVMARNTKAWVLRGGLALLIALVGLSWVVRHASEIGASEHVQRRLDRQAEEFVDRGELEEKSSGVKHAEMMLHGYLFPLKQPLGLGLGATTQAARRFGSGGLTSETHLGNSFIALGLPGGFVYHIVIAFVFLGALRYWAQSRSVVALGCVGVLCVTTCNLLGGGLYSVGPLIAFCAGAVDRLRQQGGQHT